MSAYVRDRFLIRALGLVPERIAFVRHLVMTGRVTDGPPPPVVVDAPVVLPHWDVPTRADCASRRGDRC